jgi:hypothetical protein
MAQEHTQDTALLGELYRLIANHDRRFHNEISRILDAMGVPSNEETNNTVELWQK